MNAETVEALGRVRARIDALYDFGGDNTPDYYNAIHMALDIVDNEIERAREAER